LCFGRLSELLSKAGNGKKEVNVAKRDLRLNSLSRYSKESPRLVLEEHGHCEVPAGCGGVVLRWTNPQRSIPVEFWMESTGETDFYLDGSTPRSGRPMVPYGEHVLGFHILHADPALGVLLFAGIYDEDKLNDTTLSRKSGKKIQILSADDGTWKYTVSEPDGDSWMTPGFDDSTWKTMTGRDFPVPGEQDRNRYRLNKLRELGAGGLTVPGEADRIWVRKVFSLSRM
jgi:hypothetical protein